jgi:hypothetical protein
MFGFAILEGGTRLLDWGVRSYDKRSALGVDKIARLLDYYQPSLVVIRKWWLGNARVGLRASAMARAAGSEARRRLIESHSVGIEEFRRFFVKRGCTTKHAIASLVADWFDEVAWRVPAKRRPWDSECPRALIFDAIAAAVVFQASK